MNPLNKLRKQGQSIWLDLLSREIMDSGKLQSLIDNDDLRGLTSNPSIFEKAISGSSDYDVDVARLSKEETDNTNLFFNIAIDDIQRAADIFKPVYDKTEGRDGFVSLEVSPYFANDTDATIEQARELWSKVNRKNIMIKIPGTKQGLPAIRECLREGININVTLLFGLPRYREITEAFMGGLEDRLKEGNSINDVSSVASFFLSRIWNTCNPSCGAIPYSLRHHFAVVNINSWSGGEMESQVKLSYLAKVMGHKQMQSTVYYYSITPGLSDIIKELTEEDFNNIIPDVSYEKESE
ncbi:MAG TPA: transaldolase family protein [Dysgonamonadaceae bacterium]|nr:transaldolase family protein [Dysgonamonadaceae bacterium]